MGETATVRDQVEAARTKRQTSLTTHTDKPRRVCLVGAGYIARTHAEVIDSLAGIDVIAIVDVNEDRARDFARSRGIERVYSKSEDLLNDGNVDCAHVLVPPDIHLDAAIPYLNAGLPVLMEKPLADSTQAAKQLLQAAQSNNAILGVNQNFVYHPAFLRLRRLIDRGQIGPIRSVNCIYNMPMRQLSSRQFGHWMFARPKNILLEQAVHPLSQICALIDDIRVNSAHAGPPREISPGRYFYSRCQIALQGPDIPAHIHMELGRSFPFWQLTVVGEDGVIIADMVHNRTSLHQTTRWLNAADDLAGALCHVLSIGWQGIRNAASYGRSTMGIGIRSDAFFQSMRNSIKEFHAALDRNQPPYSDGHYGMKLVELCEQAAQLAFKEEVAPRLPIKKNERRDYDVLIIGGTGFIGRHLVNELLSQGKTIGVMARSIHNLPAAFYDDNVVLVQGDATNKSDLDPAIARTKTVVNLAHGGGGETWKDVEHTMVGSAQLVANVCLDRAVSKLIHVGSIAGLYLGDDDMVVTGATPPDAQAERRADYARGKAEVDRLLLDCYKEKGLPVCILRPGIVVGEGASPFHSGIGLFNNEQHCLGWNAGRNELPLVWVEDVARAIALALERDEIAGKSFNLVGDVRLSACEYMAELAKMTNRPLKYHSQWAAKLQAIELLKWIVKRLAGRNVALPSYRDLKSRGMTARFDTQDVKDALSWQPIADRQKFIRRAIAVHG